jgi:GNAT superfamily N-acetyltransferase
LTFQISDLRLEPAFFDTVADRVWRAWWKLDSYRLISSGLVDALKGGPIPFAIVAHDGSEFIGSTLGIASDMADHPQYSPWVAAVWVEPQHRLKQVGRALVGNAAQVLFVRGFPAFTFAHRPSGGISTRGRAGCPSRRTSGSTCRRSIPATEAPEAGMPLTEVAPGGVF